MSVQTRSQLQASALTITNETAAGANTAARVGGLFDDLADTATLNRERGVACLTLASGTVWTPTNFGNAEKLTSAFVSGVVSDYNFTVTTNSITFTGLAGTALRISANLSANQTNNAILRVSIAKNDAVIQTSTVSLAFRTTLNHAIYCEAIVSANPLDKFEVYLNAFSSGQNILFESCTFTAHTL